MRKPRGRSPEKAAPNQSERIRELVEESDERVAAYFREMEVARHVTLRTTPGGRRKRVNRGSTGSD